MGVLLTYQAQTWARKVSARKGVEARRLVEYVALYWFEDVNWVWLFPEGIDAGHWGHKTNVWMILIAREPVLFQNMQHISLLQGPFAWIHWHTKRQITALRRKSRNGWSSPQSVMAVKSCVNWRNDGSDQQHPYVSSQSGLNRYQNFTPAILNNPSVVNDFHHLHIFRLWKWPA